MSTVPDLKERLNSVNASIRECKRVIENPHATDLDRLAAYDNRVHFLNVRRGLHRALRVARRAAVREARQEAGTP